ncbi:MAG: hypothetical protein AB1635_01250 [Acidobacteriota bacterium]
MVRADTDGAARQTPAELTPGQADWAARSERLWSRAREIAARNPEVDVSDVYHALRCLTLTPSQRLAAGLSRGRLRADRR